METDPKALAVRPGPPPRETALIPRGSAGLGDPGDHQPLPPGDSRPPNLTIVAAVLGPTVLGLAQHEAAVAMGLLAVMGLILLAYRR